MCGRWDKPHLFCQLERNGHKFLQKWRKGVASFHKQTLSAACSTRSKCDHIDPKIQTFLWNKIHNTPLRRKHGFGASSKCHLIRNRIHGRSISVNSALDRLYRKLPQSHRTIKLQQHAAPHTPLKQLFPIGLYHL
jgi:hypothetical protein